MLTVGVRAIGVSEEQAAGLTVSDLLNNVNATASLSDDKLLVCFALPAGEVTALLLK